MHHHLERRHHRDCVHHCCHGGDLKFQRFFLSKVSSFSKDFFYFEGLSQEACETQKDRKRRSKSVNVRDHQYEDIWERNCKSVWPLVTSILVSVTKASDIQHLKTEVSLEPHELTPFLVRDETPISCIETHGHGECWISMCLEFLSSSRGTNGSTLQILHANTSMLPFVL